MWRETVVVVVVIVAVAVVSFIITVLRFVELAILATIWLHCITFSLIELWSLVHLGPGECRRKNGKKEHKTRCNRNSFGWTIFRRRLAKRDWVKRKMQRQVIAPFDISSKLLNSIRLSKNYNFFLWNVVNWWNRLKRVSHLIISLHSTFLINVE